MHLVFSVLTKVSKPFRLLRGCSQCGCQTSLTVCWFPSMVFPLLKCYHCTRRLTAHLCSSLLGTPPSSFPRWGLLLSFHSQLQEAHTLSPCCLSSCFSDNSECVVLRLKALWDLNGVTHTPETYKQDRRGLLRDKPFMCPLSDPTTCPQGPFLLWADRFVGRLLTEEWTVTTAEMMQIMNK